MKLLALFLCCVAYAAAQDGYGAPPPPPEPTTGSPCEPLDESIPEECRETDADSGCQVAIENCPEPTTVAPEEEPMDEAAKEEGYGEEKAEEPAPEEPAPEEPAPEEPAPEENVEKSAEEETVEEPATEETAEETAEEPASEETAEEPAPEETDEETAEEPAPEDTAEGTAEEPAPEDTAEGTAEEPAPEATGEEPAPAEAAAPAEETEESSNDTDELPEEGMDVHEYCCWWAQEGECDSNAYWMRPRCQKSCGTAGCKVEGAKDCAVAVATDDCQWQKAELEGATGEAGPAATVEKVPSVYTKPEGECVDSHRLCNFWAHAKTSECEANPEYMDVNCPAACGKC